MPGSPCRGRRESPQTGAKPGATKPNAPASESVRYNGVGEGTRRENGEEKSAQPGMAVPLRQGGTGKQPLNGL